ncbi:MAG: DUF58 domain-containing protein [Azoarcus sp.]|jgi:uncharacterized protein (DUF58 family)|nr:DUF58 domain-containing protein [Azoarcus sp.]
MFAATLDRLRLPLRPRRPRTPESEPVRLHQHRIYVLPTSSGLVFGVALALMLVNSINYGLSLGYAFTFLLAGTAVASVIHAVRNLLRLSVRHGKVEAAFSGGNAVFHLLIDNPDPRRRPALRLSAGENEGRGEVDFDLPPTASVDVALALPAPRRGILPLGRVVLETRWPLGLVRAWSVFLLDAEALVYPAPAPEPPPPPGGAGKGGGEDGSARAGNEDFAGLRTYQNTDSPRHLAWKVIARGGEMMTKQFSSPAGADLDLDWNALPAGLGDEARLSILAAWLLRAEHDGSAWALRLPGREFALDRGDAHLARCLAALAVYGLPARSPR